MITNETLHPADAAFAQRFTRSLAPRFLGERILST